LCLDVCPCLQVALQEEQDRLKAAAAAEAAGGGDGPISLEALTGGASKGSSSANAASSLLNVKDDDLIF
jgi:hypothetical protein